MNAWLGFVTLLALMLVRPRLTNTEESTVNDKEKTAYAVISNTDLTEGRGYPVLLHLCEIPATAHRLASGKGVMGSPAHIETFTVRLESGWWYGPVSIVTPTKDDMRIQRLTDERDAAIAKAKAAGLDDETIAAITRQSI